ncbi:hypothetical protein [Nocardiopsis sp. CNT312]|uniref:hypothetical protein n=1 Tax=Nocardiopsis sp. CNT312 TaxID=1137268 RepID=UPI00048AC253|nr:hypothetical protein [Nocardiopsis sp. CNT312]
MFGYHGLASASGVRAAVCAAPVRRFLLLAGLLAAGLIALWAVSAVPAHAERTDTGSVLPVASAVLADATGERREEAPDPGLGVPLRTGLQSTDTAADTVAGALGGASGAPSLADGAADAVGAPVAATVRQVSDTVAARAVDVPVDTVPVVRQVRDTVGATLASGTADRVSSHTDAVEHGSGSTASSVAGGSPYRDTRATVGSGADCAQAGHGQDAGGTPGDGVRAVSAERSVSVPSTTPSAAPSGAVGGLGVVGYLPTNAAPSPLPGRYEAARHVLRSVPADSADEPTFSPD